MILGVLTWLCFAICLGDVVVISEVFFEVSQVASASLLFGGDFSFSVEN